MKIKANSLQLGSVATLGRPSARKALIGGGWIATPAVTAHVRKNASDADSRVPEARSADRKAVIGGGAVTTPGVAAHVRRKMKDAAGTQSK